MNILICEDEPITAERIRRLATGEHGSHRVISVGNGTDAIEAFATDDIDLVLLDINLPDMTGFEVAEFALDKGCHLIFITAYDEYAIRAFEVGAIDYLLKPVEETRFTKALQRARQQLNLKEKAQQSAELKVMLQQLRYGRDAEKYIYDFWVKDRDRRIRIPIEGIRYLEASRDYLILHIGNRHHMIRRTMQDTEKQLDPSVMLRVHRSYFVNLKHIDTLVSADGKKHFARLKSGELVPVGPAYHNSLQLAIRRFSLAEL